MIYPMAKVNRKPNSKLNKLLTPVTFVVGDERGSRLHLELSQCLLWLNRFAIVDQIPTASEVWSQLLDLLLQFPDGVDAPHGHGNLRCFRDIKDIHQEAFRT